MCIFTSLLDYSKSYVKYLRTCRNKWDECRRCYKWLSIIPLTLAHLLAASCVFLFLVGTTLCATGNCLVSCGDACGSTEHIVVDEHGRVVSSSVTDDGLPLKCLGIAMRGAGLACILGGFGCLLGSFLMLGLSCLYLYEEINMGAPVEWFVLMEGEQYPKFLKRRKEMNKTSELLGHTGNVIEGQLVYTGWILTTDQEWVHCNKKGKMVVVKYSKEEYERYLQQSDLEMNAPAPTDIPIAQAVLQDVTIDSANVQTATTPASSQQPILSSSMSEKEKFAAKIKHQSSMNESNRKVVNTPNPAVAIPEEKSPADVEASGNIDDVTIQPATQAYATVQQNDD